MPPGELARLLALPSGANAAALPPALGRACLQGGLFVLAVALICRLCPRLPSRLRFWLWWLACAKLLAALFLGGLIPLSLPTPPLAARLPALPSLTLARPLLRQRVAAPALREAESVLPRAAEAPPVIDTEAPAERPQRTVGTTPPRAAFGDLPLLRLISSLYVVGLLAALARLLYGAAALRRLLRDATPVNDAATREAVHDIAARLSYDASRLRLRESARIASPLVAGALRPTLALPLGFVQAVGPDQARLALAHELSHLRRHDLLLGFVPGAARTLLWFFPLAAFAARECDQACEEVCDSGALTLCPGPRVASEYARLLLRLSEGRPRPSALPNALGMAATPGFARLKRRMMALRHRERPLGPVARGLMTPVIGLLGAALLPWRLTAFAALEREHPRLPRLSVPPISPAPRFAVVDLGTLGGAYSEARGINDAGRIVGAANVTARRGGRGHAFVYDPVRGRMVDIGAAPFRRSAAVGVNRQGTVAGLAFNRKARSRLFVWDGRRRRFLGTLPGFRYGQAAGISDEAVVAGTALNGRDPDNGATRARAVLYENGRPRDLGTLGGPYSCASAITPSGVVIGKADLPPSQGSRFGPTHAFLRLPGDAALRDLGTLPGGENSRAWGANRRGEVVGYSDTDEGASRAFLVAEGAGAMHDLGALPGGGNSVAYAIGDNGWVVGAASLPSDAGREDATRAVLWDRAPGQTGGALVDLNEQIPENSGWTLEVARGINRRGWIVGQGRFRGKRHAFLLKPVAGKD